MDDVQSSREARHPGGFFQSSMTVLLPPQVVVSSDKFPKEIPDLEERIQSRFGGASSPTSRRPIIENTARILNRKRKRRTSHAREWLVSGDHGEKQHPRA